MARPDPFRHHPELRGRIDDPEASFMRSLSTDLLEQLAREHDLPGGWWYSDAERDALRAAAMAGRWGRDLWVFGYGSLMWDPALRFAEVRRARIEGYARRFILKDVRGGRGTWDNPGLFAALDSGPGCEGLAFRIAAEELETETRILWQREQVEPGYRPVFVAADLGDAVVEALAFVADHAVDLIDATLCKDEQARMIAGAAGVLGTSADYLRGITAKLDELGIEDAETAALAAEVERLQAGAAGP